MNDLLLAPHTTLRLGGPARRIVVADTESAIVAETTAADAEGEELLLLGGGSNVVISDAGFAGTAVLIRTTGISLANGLLTVAAGTPWDDVVAFAVNRDLAGIECLAGIPGSTGATPVQNIGAYGQDVSQTITAVKLFDRRRKNVLELPGNDCGFGYRNSRFKTDPGRFAVLSVTFGLDPSPLSRPIAYRELSEKLGVGIGSRAPLAAVRAAVLALRSAKGMLFAADDPDSRSVGSFFVNPIVTAAAAALMPHSPPGWPEPDGRVKLSAAWLVQQAGFPRGFGDAGARVSSKHALALTVGKGGTTDDLLTLAARIQAGVLDRFGIELAPEPVLVGADLERAEGPS